jgi:hypothetical protein
MLYIGFLNTDTGSIGLARSSDGVNRWERFADNPIIRSALAKGVWDYDSVYKPFAMADGDRWLLWYNGRSLALNNLEQIGLAIHDGAILWP